MSVVLSFIKVENIVKEEKTIDIYVISNPIHTEFLLPVKNDEMNWLEVINPSDFEHNVLQYPLIAIGWGDKGFYTEMPYWKDFTLKLALNALFIPTESVLHLDFYPSPEYFQFSTKKLTISKRQYKILVNYIRSFFVEHNGKLILHRNKNYSATDNFYKSKSSFHLFNTCNMWTNDGLKRMGIKTSLWSPFKFGILKHL